MAQGSGAPVSITAAPTTPRVFSSDADKVSATLYGPDGEPASYVFVDVDSTSPFAVLVRIGWGDGTVLDDYVKPGATGAWTGRGASGIGKINYVELRGSTGTATGVIWAVRGR